MSNYFNQILRTSIQKVRKRLNADYQQLASDKIGKNIEQLHVYQEAKHIAFYHAFNGEPNLNTIWINSIKKQKLCYFPILKDNQTLSFIPATSETTWHPNRFGIQEPESLKQDPIEPNTIDLMFVPLVAFDRFGGRLGMGAGYYDKTLAPKKPKCLIGVAYDFQRQIILSQHARDISLNAIVTPSQIYWSPKV